MGRGGFVPPDQSSGVATPFDKPPIDLLDFPCEGVNGEVAIEAVHRLWRVPHNAVNVLLFNASPTRDRHEPMAKGVLRLQQGWVSQAVCSHPLAYLAGDKLRLWGDGLRVPPFPFAEKETHPRGSALDELKEAKFD